MPHYPLTPYPPFFYQKKFSSLLYILLIKIKCNGLCKTYDECTNLVDQDVQVLL